jgi:hypothetical protein
MTKATKKNDPSTNELRIIMCTIKSRKVRNLENLRKKLSLSNFDMSVLLDISESSWFRLKKTPNQPLSAANSVLFDYIKHRFELE